MLQISLVPLYQGEMFGNQGILTVSGCPKLPTAANGPVDTTDDEYEMVCIHVCTCV